MFWRCWMACVVLLVGAGATVAADYKLERSKAAPEGLAPEVAQQLNASGYQVVGPKGAVAEFWFANEVAVKDGFKPSLAQMYPLQAGQFLGAMRVSAGSNFTDFRNQQLKAATYTLRFGLQPSDGNHVGTSETSDFLLALPATFDTKIAPITSTDSLSKASAKASGATHPAIFSLVDPKTTAAEPKLEKVGADHWVLHVTLNGKAKDQPTPVKLRLIVVGHFEG